MTITLRIVHRRGILILLGRGTRTKTKCRVRNESELNVVSLAISKNILYRPQLSMGGNLIMYLPRGWNHMAPDITLMVWIRSSYSADKFRRMTSHHPPKYCLVKSRPRSDLRCRPLEMLMKQQLL